MMESDNADAARQPGRRYRRVSRMANTYTATQRQRMRAAGHVLRQQWVPDYDNPAFRARMRRQVEALNGSVPEEAWLFDPDVPGWK